MKKKSIIFFVLLILVVIFELNSIFGNKKIENVKGTFLSNNKKYYDPNYNKEYLININEISLKNSKIKNKYQFVFISDLQASIPDENEKDEKIKKSLQERYDYFTSLNQNKVGQKEIFEEIVNYSNNRNVDALLLGGDIIDSPSNSNFELLRENLKENLKVKYLYTLGNHDWSFSWDYHTKNAECIYYPKFKDYMEDINVSYLEYKDLIILAINDSKDKIEKESIEKIKKVLEKNKPTIVMLHVPISTKYIEEEAVKLRNRVSTIGEDGIKPDKNTQEAFDLIFSNKYNVFYVLAGHIHYSLKDKLNNKIVEEVSAPAYEGKINLIKINN